MLYKLHKIYNERKANDEAAGNPGTSEFFKAGSTVYMALIGSEPMSAYQLAKKIAIARPSIYNALLDKGMVELVPDQTALYTAQEPEVLLGRMQAEMTQTFLSPGNSWKNMRRRSSRRCISYSGALKRRWQGQGSFWRMPGRRFI